MSEPCLTDGKRNMYLSELTTITETMLYWALKGREYVQVPPNRIYADLSLRDFQHLACAFNDIGKVAKKCIKLDEAWANKSQSKGETKCS